MENNICENYNTCRLVNAEDFTIETAKKQEYLKKDCTAGHPRWSECKRFIVKRELGFCPDFVLPDSKFTIAEVVDKFDEGKN